MNTGLKLFAWIEIIFVYLFQLSIFYKLNSITSADTGQGPIDDMEISPSPSPSPSSSYRSSAAGTPQLPPTSTPIATSSTPAHNPVSTPGSAHRSSSPQGNPIPTLVNRQTVNEGGTYDKSKFVNMWFQSKMVHCCVL